MSTDAAFDRKKNVAEFFGALAAPGFGLDLEMFMEIGERLVRFVDIGPSQKVLDVASGRGANLFPASSMVGERGSVIGIDLAESMVEESTSCVERSRDGRARNWPGRPRQSAEARPPCT